MDLLLTLVICFTQFALGFMGVHLALRPPKNPANHKYWIAAFVLIGLTGIGATGWLAKRAGEAQEKSTAAVYQSVDAATKANTAATKANNSVHDAQKDVQAARNEANATKKELSQLINRRSKETSTAIFNLSTATESSFKAIGTLTPPPRRIPQANRAELISFFSKKPSTVRIEAIANDVEAYRFAQDWYEVLHASGWTIIENRIGIFMSGGQPLQGVNIKFRGEPMAPNQVGNVPSADPIGYIVRAMDALKVVFTGERLPEIAEGLIVLDVYSEPK